MGWKVKVNTIRRNADTISCIYEWMGGRPGQSRATKCIRVVLLYLGACVTCALVYDTHIKWNWGELAQAAEVTAIPCTTWYWFVALVFLFRCIASGYMRLPQRIMLRRGPRAVRHIWQSGIVHVAEKQSGQHRTQHTYRLTKDKDKDERVSQTNQRQTKLKQTKRKHQILIHEIKIAIRLKQKLWYQVISLADAFLMQFNQKCTAFWLGVICW